MSWVKVAISSEGLIVLKVSWLFLDDRYKQQFTLCYGTVNLSVLSVWTGVLTPPSFISSRPENALTSILFISWLPKVAYVSDKCLLFTAFLRIFHSLPVCLSLSSCVRPTLLLTVALPGSDSGSLHGHKTCLHDNCRIWNDAEQYNEQGSFHA